MVLKNIHQNRHPLCHKLQLHVQILTVNVLIIRAVGRHRL